MPVTRTRSALAAICVLVLTTMTGAGSAVASPAPGAPPPAGNTGPTRVLTLVTGDKVAVGERPDGRSQVTVIPGPGRDRVMFRQRTNPRTKHLTVLPADAAGPVADGRLDARLFDVTELARQGFDRGTDLPLIVSGAAPLGAASAVSARTIRALPSVNAVAVAVDKNRAGEFFGRLAGAGRVWLNARERVSDDVSNPQVGAPVAWAAGYTGKGVTIADLDTGYDAGHPDLAGVVDEALDFTGTGSVADGIGHGTHTASIIAGRGTASGGKYKGVAPDARLLIGKVCTDDGFCADDAIIAGMEWAAGKRVAAVNLSLGGDPTDGTDPLSQAVNNLTVSSGTLFVIAAGNSGRPFTVGTPGAADAALTVGSVTKSDELSYFSSQGPRIGDFAVKPDLTAPGSDIIAARAAGTSMGNPVDQYYTSASGTSMATPHVTGAAALLAQQHPAWRAAEVKAALASAAAPRADLSVYQQGTGRLDVGRAVAQPVVATTGSLNFGLLHWPQSSLPPATRTVTYRNDGDADITLALALAASGPDGAPAPAGLFGADDHVTVPAHGTASAIVTLAPAKITGTGGYSARVTATAPGVVVQTAIGATAEAESYDLTVNIVGRDGQPALGTQFFDLFSPVGTLDFASTTTGTKTIRLPRERYSVTAAVDEPAAQTLVHQPQFTLDRNRTITLDARPGKKIGVVTDRRDAVRRDLTLDLVLAGDGFAFTDEFSFRDQVDVFAVPVTVPDPAEVAFGMRATLTSPEGAQQPYTYNIAVPNPGPIPAALTFRVRDRDLAAVRTSLYAQGVAALSSRGSGPLYLPDQFVISAQFVDVPLPSQRLEFFSAGGITWFTTMIQRPASQPHPTNFDGFITDTGEVFAAGHTYHRSWNRAAFSPDLQNWKIGSQGVYRYGDTLQGVVWMMAPGEPNHGAYAFLEFPYVTGTTKLTRNGTAVGEFPYPGFGVFTLPPDPATYTLEITADRKSDWSTLSTHVSTSWTFTSAHTDPNALTPLPLLTVRPSSPLLDQYNHARPNSWFALDLSVLTQAEATPVTVRTLTLQASSDDGATWQPVRVACGHDGRWFAFLRNPAKGFVSLRATATDTTGGSVTETIIRAYQIG